MGLNIEPKNKVLIWVCMAGLLGKLVEFSYSAVLPIISEQWGLTSFKAGLIFSIFRGGYLLAILPIGILTDILGTRRVMIVSSLIVGVAGGSFAMFSRGFFSGLLLRGIAGIGGAGIYIPGIKLLSEWFPKRKRGKAIGLYVGVFILGSAISLVGTGWIASGSGWRTALGIMSMGAIVSACIIYFLVSSKRNPHTPRNLKWLNLKLLKNKPLMLTIMGYAGHNWELFGMWSWIAPFLIACAAVVGWRQPGILGPALAGGIIGLGGLGSLFGGYISDRIGRLRASIIMLGVSGISSLIFGWLLGGPLVLVVLFGLIYGFFIVGDSPVFSTQVTEFAPKKQVGSALGLQSFIGFIPTVISPAVFGAVLDVTGNGWGWAFSTLAFGAFAGMSSSFLLRRRQRNLQEIKE